ncbi:MAG: cyclic nucleotide-binding domain-containing protein [Candidatus Aminicenantes bacterium]|nr:cyclic nucleotide-binding domain-containing protein [Candidatus Aminicenantes bacterium]
MKISLPGEIQLLKTVSLFHALKEEDLRIIALTTENIIYEAGEAIVNEGEEGGEAYMIYTGAVEVSRITDAGQSMLLNRMGPGGLFGELALFGNGLRTASVKAVEETLVSVISKERLYAIIRAFPDIGIEMLKAVTERFARVENRMMRSLAHEK